MLRVKFKEDFTILTAIDRNADDAAYESVLEVAEFLVNDIRSHWSGSSPSPVGAPPGVDFGFLDEGVKVDDQGRTGGKFSTDAQTAFVRIDTSESGRQYADAVQTHSKRPYFEPALDRTGQQFPSHMKKFFSRVTKR
jgi:hypothetical protein